MSDIICYMADRWKIIQPPWEHQSPKLHAELRSLFRKFDLDDYAAHNRWKIARGEKPISYAKWANHPPIFWSELRGEIPKFKKIRFRKPSAKQRRFRAFERIREKEAEINAIRLWELNGSLLDGNRPEFQ